jgi:hypothetical protein
LIRTRKKGARLKINTKSRIGRVVVGALFVASATMVATPGSASGSASAGDTSPSVNWDHTFSGRGAKVYVEEHGDIISLCDSAKNGHGAWLSAEDSNGRSYTIRVTRGKYSCTTARASNGHNLAEGLVVLYWDGEGRTSTNYGADFVNDH